MSCLTTWSRCQNHLGLVEECQLVLMGSGWEIHLIWHSEKKQQIVFLHNSGITINGNSLFAWFSIIPMIVAIVTTHCLIAPFIPKMVASFNLWFIAVNSSTFLLCYWFAISLWSSSAAHLHWTIQVCPEGQFWDCLKYVVRCSRQASR